MLSYIKRLKWDAVEFKTDDTLIYFLELLASEVYGNNKNWGIENDDR